MNSTDRDGRLKPSSTWSNHADKDDEKSSPDGHGRLVDAGNVGTGIVDAQDIGQLSAKHASQAEANKEQPLAAAAREAQRTLGHPRPHHQHREATRVAHKAVVFVYVDLWGVRDKGQMQQMKVHVGHVLVTPLPLHLKAIGLARALCANFLTRMPYEPNPVCTSSSSSATTQNATRRPLAAVPSAAPARPSPLAPDVAVRPILPLQRSLDSWVGGEMGGCVKTVVSELGLRVSRWLGEGSNDKVQEGDVGCWMRRAAVTVFGSAAAIYRPPCNHDAMNPLRTGSHSPAKPG